MNWAKAARACLLVSPLFGALLGCSSPKAHRFDVTLTESKTMACTAEPIAPFVFAKDVENIRKATEVAWANQFQAVPPQPFGQRLVVVDGEEDVTAWFDNPNTGAAVFVGAPHDEYLQADWVVPYNPYPPMAGANFMCPAIESEHDEILATRTSGVLSGRVRRTQTSFIVLGITPCDAVISCVRNQLIEGGEE